MMTVEWGVQDRSEDIFHSAILNSAVISLYGQIVHGLEELLTLSVQQDLCSSMAWSNKKKVGKWNFSQPIINLKQAYMPPITQVKAANI